VKTKTTPLLAALLAGACQSNPPSATDSSEADIRAGDAASGQRDRVFKVYKYGGTMGTGTLVRYPRCILTAGHNDTNLISDNFKWQARAKSSVLGGSDADWAFKDLQVVYTEAKTGPRGLEFTGPVTPIGEASFPGAVQFLARGIPHRPVVPTPFVLAGPLVTAYGFGFNASHNGTPTGAGTLRRGQFHVTGFVDGAQETPAIDGRAVILQNDNGHGICSGDSGGPVLSGGHLVAVLSQSNGADCTPTEETGQPTHRREAGFATMLEGDRHDWVDRTIEALCGKTLNVAVSGGGGTVRGYRQSEHLFSDDDTINGDIDCGDSFYDCVEVLHEGESIDLEAEGDEDMGIEFIQWTGARCPCDGSDSTTCTVDSSIGEYTEDESIDDATCVAEFTEEEIEDDYCDETSIYYDADQDGFGDDFTETWGCPDWYYWVEIAGDCDDTNPDVHPYASESCDGLDNDCDGEVDPEYACYEPAPWEDYVDPATEAEEPYIDDNTNTDDDADPNAGGYSASISVSCGSYNFDAPEDGGIFWVTLDDGSTAEGYTSYGTAFFCDRSGYVDAMDWGPGAMWETGSVSVQAEVIDPYCTMGEVSESDACTPYDPYDPYGY